MPVLDRWHVQEGVRRVLLCRCASLDARLAQATAGCGRSRTRIAAPTPRHFGCSDDCSHLHRYIPSRMEPCQYLQRDGVCNKPNCEFMHEEGEAGTGRKVLRGTLWRTCTA